MTYATRLATIAIGAAVVISLPTTAGAHVSERAKAQREHIVARAENRIGKDYCWGGDMGCFDCSGLTHRVFEGHGAHLPHSTRRQWRARNRDGWLTLESASQLRRGDLVFFKNTYRRGVSHVGIYVGDHRFVHAGDRVERSSLDTRYWRRHFKGGVRPPSLRFMV